MKQKEINEILNSILNDSAKQFFSLITEIQSSFKGYQYIFLPIEEYQKATDIYDLQYIYWLEIVERCHIVALTALFRNYKWIEAIFQAYANENFYAFSSCLRSFIESCGDAQHSIKGIPLTLAANFKMIKLALAGQLDFHFDNEKLENELIHYTHGRKLHGDEKKTAPKSHNALHVTDYVGSPEKVISTEKFSRYDTQDMVEVHEKYGKSVKTLAGERANVPSKRSCAIGV
jgi:hypothetical protein